MNKKMIDTRRLADTFLSLASIDSISGQEKQLAEEIIRLTAPIVSEVLIDQAGLHIGSNTGNLILKIKGNRPVATLMFNAHMDTVEPGLGVRPQYKNGIFTSDGSTILGADDKGAIAIIIETLRIIHEQDLPHGPLDIVFTVCEEIGLKGIKHLDFSMVDAQIGYALDTADTECIITNAPSANHFEIIVHGKDAHAGADPEKGINAISLACKAIAQLELGRVDEETTCNIGFMEAPGATNIVPNRVTVKGEVRSHDEKKLDAVTSRIISTFENVIADFRLKRSDDGLPRMEVRLENEFPKTDIPHDHRVVKMAQKAAANLGRALSLKRTGGGSDANIFFSKGIVTGVIGTGMKDIHTVRESIRLEDMVKTVSLLLEIIDIHSRESLLC
ncbi:MAG: M20/M25/M40 family metallo-hydrolase [Desulfobacterales bacterium]|jgi:tripeptide aminopeptidase|nr:M20/M25/M40 family metallo-hydrolase [Desulfobacterales bacterium]